LGPGKCLLTIGDDADFPVKFLVTVIHPKFKDYGFVDGRYIQTGILGRSLGVTTYQSVLGTTQQAVKLEVLYMDE